MYSVIILRVDSLILENFSTGRRFIPNQTSPYSQGTNRRIRYRVRPSRNGNRFLKGS